MRKIFLIVGALLAVIVAAGMFLLWRASQPVVYELPVAVTDIPAGTVLRPTMFRLAKWSNLDPESVGRFITVDEFEKANGKVTVTDIRAGFPIAESQVDPNSNSDGESRLSVVISGTKTSYMVIPVSPDSAGNFVQPGDRVDVVLAFNKTDSPAPYSPLSPEGELLAEDKSKAGGQQVQDTAALFPPASKLIVQNLRVLRVDREIPRDQNSNNATDADTLRQKEAAKRVADVKRIYVEVTRDQLEVMSFAINNGTPNIAVRSSTADKVIEPTEGVTWSDFMRWFYIQRGKQIHVDSLRHTGPYEAAPQE